MKPLSSLRHMSLLFDRNYIGDNTENMKFIMKGLKNLNNIESLFLSLFGNNLGHDSENLKLLSQGMA